MRLRTEQWRTNYRVMQFLTDEERPVVDVWCTRCEKFVERRIERELAETAIELHELDKCNGDVVDFTMEAADESIREAQVVPTEL